MAVCIVSYNCNAWQISNALNLKLGSKTRLFCSAVATSSHTRLIHEGLQQCFKCSSIIFRASFLILAHITTFFLLSLSPSQQRGDSQLSCLCLPPLCLESHTGQQQKCCSAAGKRCAQVFCLRSLSSVTWRPSNLLNFSYGPSSPISLPKLAAIS